MKSTLIKLANFLFLCAVVFSPLVAKADSKDDVRLFVAGEKLSFDTTGHEKAKGVRAKLFFPKTWKASEGTRPNIIQKISSEDKMATVMLQTSPLPVELQRELTAAEKKEIIAEDVLKSFVGTGEKFISYKLTALDGEPCGMMTTTGIGERAGLRFVTFGTTYVIFVKGMLFMIRTFFGGPSDEKPEVLEARYRTVEPVMRLIASSCIFPEKWERK